MKTALIIGAGGMDGTHLAELLHQRDYHVCGVDLHPGKVPGVDDWELVDILKYESVLELFARVQPDECYYLAAFHHSAEDVGLDVGDTPILNHSFSVHMQGLVHCLDAMVKVSRQTRFFYAATSHIFGIPETQPQTELSPTNPVNIYGLTKLAGVHCCRYFRMERGIYAAVGILYNHESSLRPPKFLSQKIIRGVLAFKRDPSKQLVLGDLTSTVDWGYAPDYVEAMTRILSLDKPDDFIISTGVPHTVADFLNVACEFAGVDPQQCATTRSGLLKKRPVVLIGDHSKLTRATGWEPRTSFREMVRLLIDNANGKPS